MVKRFICCCNTSTWTKVIGWVFMVINALSTVGTIPLIIFYALGYKYGENFQIDSTGSSIYEMVVENLGGYETYHITIAYMFMLLLGHIIGFIASGLLLYGTYKKKPKHIRTWIIYAVVWGILEIILEIIGCNISKSNRLAISIAIIIFILVRTTTCSFIVYNHLRETELFVRHLNSQN